MADLTNPIDPEDRAIDLARAYERRRWSREFGITEQDLEDAVKQAGSSVGKVREYLRTKTQSDG